jgi:hypothetical protein
MSSSLRDFKIRIDESYYHSIRNFYETDDWTYFTFVFQRHLINVYYSKKLDKSFVSRQWPLIPGRLAPWIITGSYGNKFISLINPKFMLEQMELCAKTESDTDKSIERDNLKRLKQLEITDNPVLLICSMRKY